MQIQFARQPQHDRPRGFQLMLRHDDFQLGETTNPIDFIETNLHGEGPRLQPISPPMLAHHRDRPVTQVRQQGHEVRRRLVALGQRHFNLGAGLGLARRVSGLCK